MSYMLSIQDETSSGEVLTSTILKFPMETVTVKALIEGRVSQEVDNYYSQEHKSFFGLVKPKEAEELLNASKPSYKKRIDVEEQQSIAIKAFQSNAFFLLVNDQQLTNLDDHLNITPNSKVVFLKLIPLVGG